MQNSTATTFGYQKIQIYPSAYANKGKQQSKV